MATFGDTTVGTNATPLSGDRGWASKFTLSEAATLNTAYWRKGTGTGAGGYAKILIYTDAGSEPGTLVATSSAIAITSGTGLLSGAISGSLTAADYYLVLVSDGDSFSGYLMSDTSAGPGMKLANGSLSYSSPPSSWPGTDADYGGYSANIYIDYTPGGGGGSSILRQMMAHSGG